ncbi:hypothetical protein ABW20_dc0105767 [Dactylellina cionopaga]|nr:hypothetical protein ABW20_dc0105767 [Dactylellina cionopaga]
MGVFGRSEKYSYTLLSGSAHKTHLIRLFPIVFLATIIAGGTLIPIYRSRQHHAIISWPSWWDTTTPAEYLQTKHQPLPVPGADESLLMLKTGAQVLWQRLPIHMTRLEETYAPNQVIYSDMEETIQGHEVIDILANVSQKLSKHEQFKTYHKMHKLHKEGVSLSEAKIDGGWDLDKYKWVPMFAHAYKNYPNMKWYIYYEADSFLFWNALNRWLVKNFDSDKDWYMGSRNMLSGTVFGYGGAGIVVSQGAMKKVFGGEKGFNPDDYDNDAISTCCGDGLLGEVMKKKGVECWSERHARFQGEQTWAIRHGPYEWCEPIFTLHHLQPMEISMLHEWEKSLDPSKPILYRDLYEQFVHKEITDLKAGWDNLSEDQTFENADLIKDYANNPAVGKDEKGQPLIQDACKLKCEEWKDCFQWQVTDKECKLNSRIRLGKKATGVVSGWMGKRINHLRTSKRC